jgi:hypothetical protein
LLPFHAPRFSSYIAPASSAFSFHVPCFNTIFPSMTPVPSSPVPLVHLTFLHAQYHPLILYSRLPCLFYSSSLSCTSPNALPTALSPALPCLHRIPLAYPFLSLASPPFSLATHLPVHPAPRC